MDAGLQNFDQQGLKKSSLGLVSPTVSALVNVSSEVIMIFSGFWSHGE